MKAFRSALCVLLCMLMIVSIAGCKGEKAGEQVIPAASAQQEDGTAAAAKTEGKADQVATGNAAVVTYKPGTYTGSAKGHNGLITVETVFSETAIVSVKVTESSETAGVGDAANEKIPQRIVDNQSLAVDAVSGASLASKAIIEAVQDCVKQAGADPAVLLVKQEKKGGEVQNMAFDVVVVGAGASGTAAALAAAEAGSSVLLLEKTSVPAGAGTMAGGMFTTGSKLQQAENLPDCSQWLYDQYMETSNYKANSRLVREVISKSGSTVDWLMENGAKFTLIDPGVGGQPVHKGDPKAFVGYVDGGSAAIGALHKSIEKKGGKILFDTKGESLIIDDKGAVIGVNATQTDGTKLVISAKSVVLATGGYAANAKMMKQYLGDKAPLGSIASATGDGINMAWKAGAAELGTDVGQFFFLNGTEKGQAMKHASDIWTVGSYPFLWVNNNGERFTNEEVIFEYAAAGNALYEQPGGAAWIVFDQGTVDQIKQKGFVSIADIYGTWKNDPQAFKEFNEPVDTVALNKFQETPYDLTPFLEEGIAAGAVVKGETFGELGEKAGMSKTVFESTAKRYAQMANAGKDSDFYKDPKYLSKLDKGPYYAVNIMTRTLTTLGGVKVNQNIQAVDDNEKVIPGLWVAGSDAGGMYSSSYVMFEGGTLGFAYISGRMAGENASGYAASIQ
ncbi:hypothetical protein A3844_14460 [Paenibacillus helianthi]|uniref:Urocanate reductase n=1 Tax=Paenibacillus helianthi TaxID=1349432 RepID=A0ABX3EML4_9BACL|nr:FAD-dependent oxidoreductase [Paenibacillus helianthi]OKP86265.1 hypothetical protein A3844_14460 [Paenibacillus helianthi]